MDEVSRQQVETTKQRGEVYALLARLFRKEVDGELLEALQKSDVFETDDEAFAHGLGMMRSYLASSDASTLDLARDYAHTFCGAGSTKKSSAYPFESVYTSREGLLMQEARDEALAWYHRFGLTKNEEWNDCEDHVALELEFVAFLAAKQAEAIEHSDTSQQDELRCAQRDFVRDHLANWMPRFAGDVDHKARTDFYRGLVRFANSYIKRDLAALDDEVRHGEEAA